MGGKKSDPNAAALDAQRHQMGRLDKIGLPELGEYVLENPELMGLLETEQLDPSAMEDIEQDPRLRDMQMEALTNLQERADEGLTAQDKYQMEELLGATAAQEMSQRKSLEQEMARRGMDSSGAALVAKLQGQQGSANNSREQAMQMAAQGQANRQNALSNLSSQAGQMGQQDFARQAQMASAKDRPERQGQYTFGSPKPNRQYYN